MEFDELVVKESPGLCRCCLSEGCYKDLGSEYTWMSETEVYADMLLECFDISITQHTEGPNGPSRLICEVCITRLRDACNFKKQVLDSEKKFVDMVGRGEFGQKVMIYQTSMRLEGDGTEAGEVEYLDDDMHFDDADDEPLRPPTESTQAVPEPSASDEIIISTLKVKGKRGRPRKVVTDKVEKKPKLSRTEDKPMTSKAVKAVKDDNEKMAAEAVRKRRKTLQNLLDNTSVIPFQWSNGYTCFYCEQPIADDLKKHVKSHGKCSQNETVAKKLHPLYTGLKIDISELTCEVCEDVLPDLDQLIDHVKEHGIKCDRKILNDVGIYKLDDLTCVHCMERFDEFPVLEKHVISACNVTIKNVKSTVCANCDKCFSSKNRLEKHIKQCFKLVEPKVEVDIRDKDKTIDKVGDNKEIDRDKLDKNNLQELRDDISSFLNSCTAMPFKFFMQRFRCFYCSKDFTDFEPLTQHTVTEHTYCDPKSKVLKSFKGRNINVKIDINSLSCKICGGNFENLDDMIQHLDTNHGVQYNETFATIIQPFKLVKDNMCCLYCTDVKFRYFSKLLEHMNEFHSKNKIICSYCGMTFGKDPNYRSHLKRHHNPNSCKCNDCDLDFDNLSKLSNHRAKIHGEKMYKCPICLECFGTQYKRQKHLIDVHESGHPCSYCGKLFTRNSFMKDHIRRSHLKEKNSECSVCKERFFDNILLRIHMVKHVGERNFHCDICGKTFLWKKNLRGHMSSHK